MEIFFRKNNVEFFMEILFTWTACTKIGCFSNVRLYLDENILGIVIPRKAAVRNFDKIIFFIESIRIIVDILNEFRNNDK